MYMHLLYLDLWCYYILYITLGASSSKIFWSENFTSMWIIIYSNIYLMILREQCGDDPELMRFYIKSVVTEIWFSSHLTNHCSPVWFNYKKDMWWQCSLVIWYFPLSLIVSSLSGGSWRSGIKVTMHYVAQLFYQYLVYRKNWIFS